MSEATAAPIRKTAGAGTLSQTLSRLEKTASRNAHRDHEQDEAVLVDVSHGRLSAAQRASSTAISVFGAIAR